MRPGKIYGAIDFSSTVYIRGGEYGEMMTDADGTDTADALREANGADPSSGTNGETDADPFATLGNETRIRIVDALYEYTATTDLADGLAYSDLRERAGVEDKGNFNYHLDVLRDQFVEKREEEYQLTFAGFEIAKALRAGAWADHEPRGPVVIESESALVDGSPLCASYEGSLVSVHAPDADPIFSIAVRPAGAAHHRIDDLVDVMATLLEEAITKTQQGVCPYCQAPPERRVTQREGARWQYCLVATCSECGPLFEVPIGAAVVRHPAVIAFYWEHGMDARTRRVWDLAPFGDDAVRAYQDDPLRLRLAIELNDATLELVLDGSGQVVETERRAANEE
jgi:DNA-binding transcriptional ArsR family regulator